MHNMDNMDKEKMNENEKTQPGNTYSQQSENKQAKAGCGCGCKAAPLNEEVVEIEEDDFTY